MNTNTERNLPARPTRVSEVRDLASIPVHSTTGPSYAGLHEPPLTVWQAGEHARRGVVETIQTLGRKRVVPVQPLLRRMGIDPDGDQPAARLESARR